MKNLQQEIFDLITLSKMTRIPVLLFSNPGYGKTTSIQKYAKMNDYYLETLIGSRFSPEEVLGYQVNENGKECLVHKNPAWYERIMAQNKKTILFIDELSTCNEFTQGALLSLIFDRRVGNGSPLPEDCLIISAANYSKNLSGFMNILPPTLNRFCLINLTSDYDKNDILENFLVKPDEPFMREVVQYDKEKFNKAYLEGWYRIFKKYGSTSFVGLLDLNNTDYANVYQGKDVIYNFISGRTLCYLRELLYVALCLNLKKDIVLKLICGTVGLGTNNFLDEQINPYIEFCYTELYEKQIKVISSKKLKDFNSIYEAVTEFINVKSSQTADLTFTESDLVDYIKEKYKDLDFIPEEKEFIKDMESIYTLMTAKEMLESLNSYKILEDIFATHFEQYCKVLNINSKLKEFLPNFRFSEIKIGKNKKGQKVRIANYNGVWVTTQQDVILSDAQFSKIVNLEDITYCE